jgi:hypothetical protein
MAFHRNTGTAPALCEVTREVQAPWRGPHAGEGIVGRMHAALRCFRPPPFPVPSGTLLSALARVPRGKAHGQATCCDAGYSLGWRKQVQTPNRTAGTDSRPAFQGATAPPSTAGCNVCPVQPPADLLKLWVSNRSLPLEAGWAPRLPGSCRCTHARQCTKRHRFRWHGTSGSAPSLTLPTPPSNPLTQHSERKAFRASIGCVESPPRAVAPVNAFEQRAADEREQRPGGQACVCGVSN